MKANLTDKISVDIPIFQVGEEVHRGKVYGEEEDKRGVYGGCKGVITSLKNEESATIWFKDVNSQRYVRMPVSIAKSKKSVNDLPLIEVLDGHVQPEGIYLHSEESMAVFHRCKFAKPKPEMKSVIKSI